MNSSPSRRDFLRSTIAVSAGFAGLHRALSGSAASAAQEKVEGFGDLIPDPTGLLDLPSGFSYRVISRFGDPMDDGLIVPGQPDGMGAFPGRDGRTILIRNHELDLKMLEKSPYGKDYAQLHRVPREMLYDAGHGKTACIGGCTCIVYDTRAQRIERQYLTLAGTQYNCAGGVTPWNSWITCEEDVATAGDIHEQDHGYAFDVPATGDGKLVTPVALKAMGRFRREAIAIDPRTGIVYQTEDRPDGLLYRYIPDKPGDLPRGGRVQVLALRDRRSCDTRNWVDEAGSYVAGRVPTATPLAVEWLRIDEIDAPKDDLRQRGFSAGAARFARGEGMWYGRKTVYWVCTNGGRTQTGQVWAYTPSPHEGTPRESENPGVLTLFLEPNDKRLLENGDNVTIAPWGDLVICEDADDKDQSLVGVTPAGGIYKIARHRSSGAEFAGSVFSPDGTTLFVNLQEDGLTLALTGPWRRG